jgi:hypothetical protein
MPTIEISQEQYDRLLAFKPVAEQVTQEQMSMEEFGDFIVFTALERLFLESAMSGDMQLIEKVRQGDTVVQAAIETLQSAQITLQGLSRHFPNEVFGFLSNVWQWMNADERQHKGMGFHVLMDEYKKRQQEAGQRQQ